LSKLQSASIDIAEIEKFSRFADEWWDLHGKFKPLHKLNPVRVGYIRERGFYHTEQGEGSTSRNKKTDSSPLAENYKAIRPTLLDIGCGGGLLCEPMRRLGADVTGIDASEKNIQVAGLHAQKSGLDINYICTSAEELAASGAQFDLVLNMEVIEHVADVTSFMEACCKLVKPGGMMIIATLNRTIKSFAFAIIGAEYILNWLPRGTHNWEKFLKPSEISAHLEKNNMQLVELKGVTLNPLRNEWHISDDIAVNYMICATKINISEK
jgi:2-polyprenyl-6-hydroxyphenyl methylase/3-demethylubiquinone-9 3-methyltransferase